MLGFEQHLPGFIEAYGMWVYALLFMIIFAETAFIAMFFLPGDSLLLSVGALCASVDFMHLDFMIMLLFAAATLGYIVNYHTGKFFGPQITSVKSRFIKPEHLARTNRYFVRHGGKTILMARFIPFVRTDTYRASGAGGQHINKTDSAVRLTHMPTGIVVACQNQRSQHANRDHAWKQLRAKLYELEMSKRNEAAQALEDSKSDIGWGSQIRSYVLDDSRIKDLRTGVENSNTGAVLDGDLDKFIEASLKQGL